MIYFCTENIATSIFTLLHDTRRHVDASSVCVQDFEDGGENSLGECLEKPFRKVFVLAGNVARRSVAFEDSGQNVQSPFLLFPPERKESML